MAEEDAAQNTVVLVLDTDAELTAAISTALGEISCRVEQADTVPDALAKVRELHPAAVILEIALPGSNGIDFLEALAQEPTPPPALVHTRLGDNDLFRRRALESGALEYLDKSMGLEVLKAAVARHLEAGSGPSAAVASERRGTHALVVDDEPVICELISKFMRHQGYRCEHAHDAEEAREMIVNEPPLVLFLDIQMPGRSGLDLLRELNSLGLRVPTMIITGLEEPSVGVEAEGLGVIGFLHKPFNFSYLKDIVLPKIELLTG